MSAIAPQHLKRKDATAIVHRRVEGMDENISFKIFSNVFELELEDFPDLERVWSALQQYRSAGCDWTKSPALRR